MKKTYFILPLMAMVLMGAGCGASSRVVVTPSGTVPAPVDSGAIPSPVLPRGNACTSEYFPLQQGYKVSYANRMSSGASQNTYTMEVTSVAANRATVSIAFDNGIRSEQVYDCTDGNVQATGYVDLAAGMSGVRASAQTRSSSGQLIPRDAGVGSSWSASFDIVTTLGGDGTAPVRTINTTVTTQRTAESEESVTVPAGTFQALKVRSSTTFVFGDAAMAGLPAMDPVVGYEWWVKGKGMVKTTSGIDAQTIVSEASAIVTP